MTQGKRQDVPTDSSVWIDHAAPAPGWEYWEERFGQGFPEEFRLKINLTRTDLKADLAIHHDEDRRSPYELRSALKNALWDEELLKNDPELVKFVEKNSVHILQDQLNVSLADRIAEALRLVYTT